MDTITLQQHFYASAPTGLTGKRGLQTVAVSSELLAASLVEPLEGHCRYVVMEDTAESDYPVNWGWFVLNDEWACLHRIGYSGNDELGRAGNFLAHNLAVRLAELEAIDFDIASVFEWVRNRSPRKYNSDQGIYDGFARRHTEVLDTFGRELAALQSVPPLSIPRAELLAIRQQIDAEIETATLPRLREVLDPQSLAQVLWGVVRSPGDSTPLVLVGLRDGCHDSRLEMDVIQTLFALAPYHVRRRLTFSTYCDRPQEFAWNVQTQRNVSPQQRLRLMMTPSLPAVRGFSAQARLLVCEARGGHPPIPAPGAELQILVNNWFSKPRWTATITGFRNRASQFAFPDEAVGFQQTERLRRMITSADKTTWTAADYDLIFEMVSSLRRSSGELIALFASAIDRFFQVLGRDTFRMTRLSASFCAALRKPADLGTSQAIVATCTLDDLSGPLGKLFYQAVQLVNHETIGHLLDLVLSDPCARVRNDLLAVYQSKFPNPPQDATTESLLQLWDAIYQRRPPRLKAYDDLLDHAARTLSKWVLDRFVEGNSPSNLDPRVLSLLAAAPLNSTSQLMQRLELVLQVCRSLSQGQSLDLAERFLGDLLRHGQLSSERLTELVTNDRRLVMAFHQPLQSLVAKAPELDASLRPALESPGLLKECWRIDKRIHSGSLWRAGMDSVWKQHLARRDLLAAELVDHYANEGADALRRQFKDEFDPAPPEEQPAVVEAHARWIRLVFEDAPRMPGTSEQRQKSVEAAQRHLLWICTVLAFRGAGLVAGLAPWDWQRDPGILTLLRQKYADPRSQGGFLFQLGGELRRHAAGRIEQVWQSLAAPLGDWEGDGELREAWKCWRHAAVWYGGQENAVWEGTLPSMIAHLLANCPEVLRSDNRASSTLTQFVANNLDDAVWDCVAKQVVNECQPDSIHLPTWIAWFGHDSARCELIDQMAVYQRGTQSLLDQVWNKIFVASHTGTSQNSGDVAFLLASLLEHQLHPRVFDPATSTMRAEGARYIDQLLRHYASQKSMQRGLWEPDTNFLAHWLQVCKILQVNTTFLSLEQASGLWEVAGISLPLLKPAQTQGCAPAIARLGAALNRERLDKAANPLGAIRIWEDLFCKLVRRNTVYGQKEGLSPENAGKFIVAVGDFLYLLCEPNSAYFAAKSLSGIDPGKIFPPARKSEASLWRRVWPLGRSGGKSPIDVAVGEPLATDLYPDQRIATRARAQFATCWRKAADAGLADLYLAACGLGGAESNGNQVEGRRRLGIAVAGFVLLEGDGRLELERRIRQLAAAHGFRKRLRRACRKRDEWEGVASACQLELQARGVPVSVAQQAAEALGR